MIEFFTYLFIGLPVLMLGACGFFAAAALCSILALPFVWLAQALRTNS